MKTAQKYLGEALEREAEAQKLLLDGQTEAAIPVMRAAAGLYRRSWEEAQPTAYGRLAGMMKAAILAGDGAEAASYTRAELADADGPVAAWVRALAHLAEGAYEAAAEQADEMRSEQGPGKDAGAFSLAADAVKALAVADADRYSLAIDAVVRDFEGREDHLTGVPIADTAMVLERLAEGRGIAARPSSPLMPSH